MYGFLALTGRFEAGENGNVGSGYWTNALSSGQTFFLGPNKMTSLSAFQMYEFHTTQKRTDIHPGQTLNLDYSVMHTIQEGDGVNVQLGIVGYNQWQTTAKDGPTLTRLQQVERYKVNAFGFASVISWPERNVSVSVKGFDEFENRSTFQGLSIQIATSIGL